MTDLTALIERVESGSGRDRQLELDIWVALGWTHEKRDKDRKPWLYPPRGDSRVLRYDPRDVIGWLIGDMGLTTSLDAVLSLIEAKLPGWGHCYATGWDADGNCGGFVSPERTVDLTKATMGQAQSPARALLAAALRAIQESRNDR